MVLGGYINLCDNAITFIKIKIGLYGFNFNGHSRDFSLKNLSLKYFDIILYGFMNLEDTKFSFSRKLSHWYKVFLFHFELVLKVFKGFLLFPGFFLDHKFYNITTEGINLDFLYGGG